MPCSHGAFCYGCESSGIDMFAEVQHDPERWLNVDNEIEGSKQTAAYWDAKKALHEFVPKHRSKRENWKTFNRLKDEVRKAANAVLGFAQTLGVY